MSKKKAETKTYGIKKGKRVEGTIWPSLPPLANQQSISPILLMSSISHTLISTVPLVSRSVPSDRRVCLLNGKLS